MVLQTPALLTKTPTRFGRASQPLLQACLPSLSPEASMSKHHPGMFIATIYYYSVLTCVFLDLIMCRRQPGIGKPRLVCFT